MRQRRESGADAGVTRAGAGPSPDSPLLGVIATRGTLNRRWVPGLLGAFGSGVELAAGPHTTMNDSAMAYDRTNENLPVTVSGT